jgi:hypothetical protein
MSVLASQSPHHVTPGLTRGPAFFRNQLTCVEDAKGSWTPDQVRGDGCAWAASITLPEGERP